MKKCKNYLACVVASLLAFTVLLGIPSSAYAGEIKSAEQSVYDYFEAVQNKDYDTINRISVNKWMSDEMLRNVIELEHEEGRIAEGPPTILASEMRDQDTAMVKVSYVLAGEEHIITYLVVLVNNEWIVNVGEGAEEGVIVQWAQPVFVTDYSVTRTPDFGWSYLDILRTGFKHYFPFSVINLFSNCIIE